MKTLLNTTTTLVIIIVVLVSILVFNLLTNRFPREDKNEHSKLDVNNFIVNMKDQMVALDSTLRKRNQSSLLKLDEVEIEAHFVINNSSPKNENDQYEILTVGNDKTYKNEQIQKITLHLSRNARRGE
jgi:uncharacterized membrane protein YhiD involved in acid resistance